MARKERYRKGKYRHGRTKECRNYDYGYIEKLLDKPLEDFRKYCIWRVFVPSYINVKGLSKLQTFDIVDSWLDKCNSIARLDFSPKQKIDYELDHVGEFTPIRADQLKVDHNKLYTRLEKEGIIC